MRKVLAALLLSAMVCSVWAQDGIYGSALFGFKYLDMTSLNDFLNNNPGNVGTDYSRVTKLNEPFTSSFMLGGEGHIILAERLVLGFTAFGVSQTRQVVDKPDSVPPIHINFTGGMVMGVVGFNLLGDNKLGWHLYPRLGVGASESILQRKMGFAGDPALTEEQQEYSFYNALADDKLSRLHKISLALDPGIGYDWYMPFKSFTILPGMNFGLMLHADAGWIFLPAKSKWLREINTIEGATPDIVYDGFYVNVGVGVGLSPRK